MWRAGPDQPCREAGPAQAIDTVCPLGFVPAPGDPGSDDVPDCQPLDSDCGADAYGGWPDAPDTRFVAQGASAGGKGTRSQPFSTLAAALKAVPNGGKVVLAAGKYTGSWILDRPVDIIGRCAAKVVLAGPAQAPHVFLVGGGWTPQDFLPWPLPAGASKMTPGPRRLVRLTLSGRGRGVQVLGNGHLVLNRVLIDRADGAGLRIKGPGANVQLQDVVVRYVQPAPWLYKGVGYGIAAGGSAKLQLLRVRLHGSPTAGLGLWGTGVSADAEDLVISGTPEVGGVGLAVDDHASVDLVRGLVAGNRGAGIVVVGGGRANLLDLTVRDSRPVGAGLGFGLEIADGTVAMAGIRLLRNRHVALQIYGGAQVEATGVVVEDTQAGGEASASGHSIQVRSGATLSLSGSRVATSRSAAVLALGIGTRLDFAGVTVRDTIGVPAPDCAGFAVAVLAGADLVLRDSVLTGSTAGAVHIVSSEADIDGTLVTATRFGSADCGRAGALETGDGIAMFGSSRIRIRDTAVTGHARAGMAVVAAQDVVFNRVLVQDNGVFGVVTMDDGAWTASALAVTDSGYQDFGSDKLTFPPQPSPVQDSAKGLIE